MSRSQEDWIEAAWIALGEGGVEAVRVERLARKLGVTKGSFYWHFKDRQDLINALLDRWFGMREEEDGDGAPATGDGGDAAMRIWKVFERAVSRGTMGQAAALRFWAQRHAKVARRIAKEDEKRFRFFTDQFQALGFKKAEASTRAQVYMGIISAEFLRAGGLDPAERLKLAHRQHDMLTGGG